MKYKIFTIALVGAGLLTTLALKPAMATESCPLQNSFQSNEYVQVKGGSHHRRGGNHQKDNYQSGKHHRSSHNNTWYFVEGLLTQINRLHNRHGGDRHHRNGHNHSSSYYYK
jgi:hypothetical protein